MILVLRGWALEQEKRERTLDEIKTEAIHRAENGMYPLIGLDPAKGPFTISLEGRTTATIERFRSAVLPAVWADD